MSEEQPEIDQTEEALKRVVNFDASKLIRLEELGQRFSFDAAVFPAQRLQSVFKKIPVGALDEFPDQQLTSIKNQANNVYKIFSDILKFDNTEPDATTKKQLLLDSLENQYQKVFSDLYPLISFAVARTVDFDQLAAEGRAAVQSVKDQTEKIMGELKETSKKAQDVLQEVREAAAEQGVTQQARYFSDQADKNEALAGNWLIASAISASILVAYTIFTLFFPQIRIFSASNIQDAIQLTASKILIFLVLSFAVLQCVKNYNAHRHNAVTNRHRQNALMTYTTLSEAGASVEARDAVLQHAAAAIYAPNDTGYIKSEERGYGGNPVVGFAPRSLFGGGQSGDGV